MHFTKNSEIILHSNMFKYKFLKKTCIDSISTVSIKHNRNFLLIKEKNAFLYCD